MSDRMSSFVDISPFWGGGWCTQEQRI